MTDIVFPLPTMLKRKVIEAQREKSLECDFGRKSQTPLRNPPCDEYEEAHMTSTNLMCCNFSGYDRRRSKKHNMATTENCILLENATHKRILKIFKTSVTVRVMKSRLEF